MNSILLYLSVLALWLGVNHASAESLKTELDGLVQSHPQILGAKKAISSADEGISVAKAGYLPKVNLTGDTGADYVNSPSRRSSNNNDPYMRGRHTAGATITQKLFDGYATEGMVDAAKITRKMGEIGLEATTQNVLLEAISAYIGVIKAGTLIDFAKNNEKNIQTQMNLEDERVKKGSGVAVDVLQSKSKLQLAKERRVAFEGAFQDSVSKYVQVYDHAPNTAKMEEPEVPKSLMPNSLEEALEAALKENPVLGNSSHAIKAAESRKVIAEAGYYPTLSLEGKANYEEDKSATAGVRRDASLLLKANWDLFSGFSTQAAVAQASIDRASSQDSYNYALRKVTEQTKVSWQALLTTKERLELLENAANIANEVWEARKKQRESGKVTVVEVLDAESEIYNARINQTNANFEAKMASFQLLAAMGRLDINTFINPR